MKRILGALALIALSSFNAFADTSGGPNGATIVVTGDCAGTGRTSIALTCSLTGEIGVTVQAWNAYLDCISALSLSPGTHLLSLGSAGSCTTKSIGADVEAYDADLDALAALSSTGLVKRTGSNAWAFAVAGTDYLAPAAIGTTVEAWNTYLDCIGALTTASSKLVAMGASGACSLKSIGTDVEAWDSDLDAVAALTSPATLISGAAQKSNNGSDFSNLTTFRSNVGLAIGTNVEAWDADLDAIAGLASTAGILKRTGAGTFGLAVSNTDYLPVASPTWTGTMNGATEVITGQMQATGGAAFGGAGSSSLLDVVGVYTTANPQAVHITPTLASSVTATQYGLLLQTQFNPSGASIGTLYGISSRPKMITTGTLNVVSFAAYTGFLDIQSGYTGIISNAYDFQATDSNFGTAPFTTYAQFYAAGTVNGNGNTSGSIFNYGYRSVGATAAAGSGGSITNYGFYSSLPTGSGAGTTTNYGLRVTGNGGSGGAGTTNNWGIYDDSTANNAFAGNSRFGGTTAPAYAVDATGDVNASGALRVGGTSIASLYVAQSAIGSTVEAWDTDLDQYAALTGAADVFPYYTAAHAMATTACNSVCRSLLSQTTVSAERSTLGLAIGSNVQAWSVWFDCIAALTPGAGTHLVSISTAGGCALKDPGTDVEAWDADLDALAALSSTAGILKRTGAGTFGLAVAGTDYIAATSGSAIQKASSGGLTAAVSNTDYLSPSSPVFTVSMNGPTYTSTGNVSTVRGGTQGIQIDGVDAKYKEVLFDTAGSQIWSIGMDKIAQSSTKSGNNFEICDWNNAGTFDQCPLFIQRSTGIADFVGLTVGGIHVLNSSDLGSVVQDWSPYLQCLANLSPSTGFLKIGSVGACSAQTKIHADTNIDNILPLANGGTGGSTPDTSQTGIGIQTLDVTSQFDKTATTTLALEPNTTLTVAASTKWKFRVRLFTTLDATGGIKVRMGLGTATITAAMYHIHATCNTTGLTLADTRLADFTTNVNYTSGCTSVDIDIDGEVSVNGAGTLGTLFAQGSASGTSSILTMSNATWTQRS